MHRGGPRQPTRSPRHTTSWSHTGSRRRCSGASRRAPGSGSRSTSRSATRRATTPRMSRPAGSSTASATAGSSTRSSAARIPADVLERLAPNAPPVRDGDMAAITAPIDFLGVNYYQRRVVGRAADGGWRIVHQDGSQHTDMGWEVSPDGLFDLLRRLHDDYAPPAIMMTENGAAFGDARAHDGCVRDPERQRLHRRPHRGARPRDRRRRAGRGLLRLDAARQLRVGVRVRAALRSRLRRLPTLERIPKSSFHWYREHIARVTSGAAGRRRIVRTAT